MSELGLLKRISNMEVLSYLSNKRMELNLTGRPVGKSTVHIDLKKKRDYISIRENNPKLERGEPYRKEGKQQTNLIQILSLSLEPLTRSFLPDRALFPAFRTTTLRLEARCVKHIGQATNSSEHRKLR